MLFSTGQEMKGRFRCPDDLNIFPVCVPVGTQVPHAAGAAMAIKYKDERRKAVAAYFGDGGTSKEISMKGWNMAGVFKLPVVFICQEQPLGNISSKRKADCIKNNCSKGICIWV